MIGNILAEDNSGTLFEIHYLNLDSDNDDIRGSKVGYSTAFRMGASAPYGGAFSIPDRVGSAPATDISVVILSHFYNIIIEIWQFWN